jgi:hypothetical protein
LIEILREIGQEMAKNLAVAFPLPKIRKLWRPTGVAAFGELNTGKV